MSQMALATHAGTRLAVDIMMLPHHDAEMRTTVDLPEDLHRIASSIARHTGRSLSQAVADLMRRGLERRVADADPPPYVVSEKTGLPVVRSPRPVTEEDVKALDDEP